VAIVPMPVSEVTPGNEPAGSHAMFNVKRVTQKPIGNRKARQQAAAGGRVWIGVRILRGLFFGHVKKSFMQGSSEVVMIVNQG